VLRVLPGPAERVVMKRLLVMFLALALALAPAASADAASGKGKGKASPKACVAKKTLNGNKGKKAKKCGKKAKKVKKAKKNATAKAAPTAPEQAAAERECRADRRLDPEGFVADFGAGKDAVAKCAAELLEQLTSEPLEEEPAEGEEIVDDTTLEPEVVEDAQAEEELL
jgi:hypothetical protein